MSTKSLFAKALGLAAPWEVTEVEFSEPLQAEDRAGVPHQARLARVIQSIGQASGGSISQTVVLLGNTQSSSSGD